MKETYEERVRNLPIKSFRRSGTEGAEEYQDGQCEMNEAAALIAREADAALSLAWFDVADKQPREGEEIESHTITNGGATLSVLRGKAWSTSLRDGKTVQWAVTDEETGVTDYVTLWRPVRT